MPSYWGSMSKVSSIKKIVVEDYAASERGIVQRLATTLNPFLDQTTLAINGQITIRENLKGKTYKLSLPAGTSTRIVAWDLNEKPTSVVIGSLTKPDGTAPSAVFSLSWRYDSKGIHLTFLGLDAGQEHISTIIAQV